MSLTAKYKNVHKSDLMSCVLRLFRKPSVVLIDGVWKTGKTDFALMLSQILLYFNSVRLVASNIDTGGHYPQIIDLWSLKRWLHETSKRKLFILDESNVHLVRRRAMSNLNVEFIKILAELSKGRGRLIVVGQDVSKIDSEFMNPVWVRGIFRKQTLKIVSLISDLIKDQHIFKNVPKTTINFDPFTVAPFSLEPDKKSIFKDEDMRKLWEWSKGLATWKTYWKHPNELNRFVRRYVRSFLSRTFTDSPNKA